MQLKGLNMRALVNRRLTRKNDVNNNNNSKPIIPKHEDTGGFLGKVHDSSPCFLRKKCRRLTRPPCCQRIPSSHCFGFVGMRKNPRGTLLIISLLIFFHVYVLHPLVVLFFGPRGSLQGGLLGVSLDKLVREYHLSKTFKLWKQTLQSELRISLSSDQISDILKEPPKLTSEGILKTRPNLALGEMLLREKRRRDKITDMLHETVEFAKNCSLDRSTAATIPKRIVFFESNAKLGSFLPYWVHSALLGVDQVTINDSDIDYFHPQRTNLFQANINKANASPTNVSELSFLVYRLGGIQLSDSLRHHRHRTQISSVLSYLNSVTASSTQSVLPNRFSTGGSCDSKLGYALFSASPADVSGKLGAKLSPEPDTVSTLFSALPKEHPASFCIPPLDSDDDKFSFSKTYGNDFQVSFAYKLHDSLSLAAKKIEHNTTNLPWGIASFPCNFDDDISVSYIGGMNDTISKMILNCCNRVSIKVIDSFGLEAVMNHIKNINTGERRTRQRNHSLFFTILGTNPSDAELDETSSISAAPIHPVSVMISKQDTNKLDSNLVSQNSHPTQRRKESIQKDLQSAWGCEPNWICNRCLKAPMYGSFSNCSAVCGTCAPNVICNTNYQIQKDVQVTVNVEVKGMGPMGNKKPIHNMVFHKLRQQRIPKIIHQTWFEDITRDKYPQLYRLQNSWRASGWEYRFYTDFTAREYIKANYPMHFVSVYDSILPGAYKADFFRYLVLYKDGGIYADVDVMLNTNLDTFVTHDLGFFAPRDAVGEHVEENFCFWNGLIGSAPAHPFLTNVIQWVVNLVNKRADIYDMERFICNLSGVKMTENWKIRAEPGLLLSGPCALGLAVNSALGNKPLSKFDTGILKWTDAQGADRDAIGNVLILVADKRDLGSFRFSDPERNIIVASTDMASLSKSPVIYEIDDYNSAASSLRRSNKNGLKPKPHYSRASKEQWLWGTRYIYVDDLVVDETVSLLVSYE